MAQFPSAIGKMWLALVLLLLVPGCESSVWGQAAEIRTVETPVTMLPAHIAIPPHQLAVVGKR